MKIILSATGENMQAGLDGRFGRCAYFVVYDSETKDVQALRNPAGESGGGAGVKAAQIVVGTGPDVVVTGNIGPNALEVLQQAGIKCFTTDSRKLDEAVKEYQAGNLREINSATVGVHAGMGGGGGRRR